MKNGALPFMSLQTCSQPRLTIAQNTPYTRDLTFLSASFDEDGLRATKHGRARNCSRKSRNDHTLFAA